MDCAHGAGGSPHATWPKTRIAISDALGATPELTPEPTAIPATWVPWKHSGANVHGTPAPAVVSDVRPLGQVETPDES